MPSQLSIKRVIFLLTLVLGAILKTFAQQDPQFSQYMYSTGIINPAYAGSREDVSITALSRAQWVGLEGAPQTQSLSFTTLAGKPKLEFAPRVGIGINFISDEIGPISEQLLNVDFAYDIATSPDKRLSFGLKAGVNLLNINFNELDVFDPTDFSFLENVQNRVSPTIGAGIYYYTDYWYVGVSVPNLIQARFLNDNDLTIGSERRTFFFTAGYVYELSNDIQLKPALLSRIISGAPISIDTSVNFIYKDRFTMGISYRYGASVNVLAAFQVNQNILIGYSYDYDTTPLASFNGGSHELTLRYRFNKAVKGRIRCCPRHF